MNQQLRDFLAVLAEVGAEVWLDSGTLLGICRDGDVIEWDRDLDLGCWSSQIGKLEQATRELRRRGYRTRLECTRPAYPPTTLLARPALWDKYRHSLRTVTVAIYQRHGNLALRPGAYFTRSQRRRWTPTWWADESLRFGLARIWRRWLYPRSMRLVFPGMRLEAFTWAIPAHFVEATRKLQLEGIVVPVPERWDEYLAFRYGDWHSPRPDWDYYRDDRAVERKPFEVVSAETEHD